MIKNYEFVKKRMILFPNENKKVDWHRLMEMFSGVALSCRLFDKIEYVGKYSSISSIGNVFYDSIHFGGLLYDFNQSAFNYFFFTAVTINVNLCDLRT